VLLASSASMIHFFARPHVVTWLFCVMWLWILDRFERPRDETYSGIQQPRGLLLLPLSMVAWVNLHGGFLLGFALLAIYWLSAIWQRFRPRGDHFESLLQKLRAGKRARNLAEIGLLSAVATFINPYGWKLHAHIYGYLSNRFLMDHIEEFQSPNFHGIAQKCFAVLLLLALFVLATKQAQANNNCQSELLLTLFAAYSGLYAARNIPVSSLLLIWVIGPRLSRGLSSMSERFAHRIDRRNRQTGSFFQRMQRIDARLSGHVWALAAIVIGSWIAFNGGRLGKFVLMNAHFDEKRLPVASVDYLEHHRLPGSIFAPDFWGGYLIYRLYPQTRVVIDDRHDFYGEQFLKSYLKTIHIEPAWQVFLVQYPANIVLVSKSSALANILMETPRWRAIHSDNAAVVFASDMVAIDSGDRQELQTLSH
jgi:hypothetical protein